METFRTVSFEGAVQIASNLPGYPYAWVPYDEPRRGMRGFCGSQANAWPAGQPAPEDARGEVVIEWPLFERPLEPQVSTVRLAEFLAIANDPTRATALAHDPKALRLGIVDYQRWHEGVALVYEMPVTALGSATAEQRAALDALRRLYNPDHTVFLARLNHLRTGRADGRR